MKVRLAGSCLLLCLFACHRGPKTPVSEVKASGGVSQTRIVRGLYPGSGGWLWTAPEFALRLDPANAAKPSYLELDITVPDELIAAAPSVTVTAKVNGMEVAHQTYSKGGRVLLAGKVPPEALANPPVTIEFFTDHTLAGEQKSLIFVSAALKEYEQTSEFQQAELAKAQSGYDEVLKQRDLKIPPEKQRELMRLFHDLPIWDHLWFHGVRIIKNPLDLWMLQQIAWEVKPDFVVETGTWQGGSALYWAHTLEGMGLVDARVLTVDIQDQTAAASTHPLWKKYVEFSLGSSTDPKITASFAARVQGKRVIVNLDSDHSMQHVLRELKFYGPMVSRGSYIAVEDTHLDGVPTHPEQGAGPMAAVRQFLKDGGSKDFEQDFCREAMVMTSYPGGWLRRK